MRFWGNFGEILNSVLTAFHQKRIHGSGKFLIFVSQAYIYSLTRRRRQIAPGRQNSITLLAVRLLYEAITILFWSIGRWFSPAPILLFELVFEKSALRVTLKVGPVSGRHLGLKKRPKTAGDRFPEEFWRISDFHENRHFSCSPKIPVPHECSGYEEAREMPLGMNPSTISVDCFWRSS